MKFYEGFIDDYGSGLILSAESDGSGSGESSSKWLKIYAILVEGEEESTDWSGYESTSGVGFWLSSSSKTKAYLEKKFILK